MPEADGLRVVASGGMVIMPDSDLDDLLTRREALKALREAGYPPPSLTTLETWAVRPPKNFPAPPMMKFGRARGVSPWRFAGLGQGSPQSTTPQHVRANPLLRLKQQLPTRWDRQRTLISGVGCHDDEREIAIAG